jgi:hypothetical protein
VVLVSLFAITEHPALTFIQERLMNRTRNALTTATIASLTGVALIHGPIPQLANYHDFADQGTVLGIAHFADVLSNLGFVLVAIWGLARLSPANRHPELDFGWGGYRLFLLGLLLTGFGSAYYHLAPDNASLVWDRLPIALACGGLLAGVWGDTRGQSSRDLAAWLALAAVISVAWWHFTELSGTGDLRPYLLMQALPIVLIPLWHWKHENQSEDRLWFSVALILYVIAKFAELNDHEIATVLGVTGHTLKHLLATFAAAVIVARLDRRVPRDPTRTVAIRPKRGAQTQTVANAPVVATTIGRR